MYICLSSVICELSVAYIIAKQLAHNILDNNRKIPMDCGKFHVMYDVTILLS